jgi:hypothetical protein
MGTECIKLLSRKTILKVNKSSEVANFSVIWIYGYDAKLQIRRQFSLHLHLNIRSIVERRRVYGRRKE